MNIDPRLFQKVFGESICVVLLEYTILREELIPNG